MDLRKISDSFNLVNMDFTFGGAIPKTTSAEKSQTLPESPGHRNDAGGPLIDYGQPPATMYENRGAKQLRCHMNGSLDKDSSTDQDIGEKDRRQRSRWNCRAAANRAEQCSSSDTTSRGKFT